MGDIISRLIPTGGDGTYKCLTAEEVDRAIEELLESRPDEITPEPMVDDLIAELDALKFLSTYWKLWHSEKVRVGWQNGQLAWTAKD